MLKQLNIQNLAIAENISVTFKNGLNVITGETGAGKSLLVDAMSLLRGCRVDTHLIRTGQESALITGVFCPLNSNSGIYHLLEELGIPLFSDDPEEIIIKRFIHRNGKHKATVNETIVSTKILQFIAGELIDISSQFENQRLMDIETHTYFLDELADNSEVYREYLQSYQFTHEKIKNIKTLMHEQNLLKREKSLYEFEIAQINNAKISIDEFKKLEEIILIGNKSASAKRICQEIIANLSQNETNCLDILKYSRKNLDKLNKNNLNSHFYLYLEQLDAIIFLVEELSHNIEVTSEKFNTDETNLYESLQRMECYNKILQKYGPSIEEVFKYKNKCELFLEKAISIDEEIQIEIQKCQEEIQKSIHLAKTLSQNRKSKLTYLSTAIERELSELGIPKAKFYCELKENNKTLDYSEFNNAIFPKDFLSYLTEFQNLNKLGFEKVLFLLSTNLGIDAQPIDKVASGGELSRIMLAIKNILFGDNSMSVFVFDEIDTGISGYIATKVGKKLVDFCRGSQTHFNRQAICITHLPQVASFAQSHFIVTKELKNNKTVTKITEASESEKLKEIAILLSGEAISQESLAQAKFLIQEAQKNFLQIF